MVKPKGRTLNEFLPLRPAEVQLKEAVEAGQKSRFGQELPSGIPTPQNCVRAGFVRFLALGGDDDAAVHENGIQIEGAHIEGPLDLGNTQKVAPLSLTECLFDHELTFTNAELAEVTLTGSHVPAVNGNSMKVRGSVAFDEGFKCAGQISLLEASIGGDFVCSGATVGGGDGDALAIEKADIKGGVHLTSKFTAIGIVSLDGATIGDNLDCSAGLFSRSSTNGENEPAIEALSFQGANIKGDVFLRDGFKSKGLVSGRGASIGGDIECCDAEIDLSPSVPTMPGAAPVAQRPQGAAAVDLPYALRLGGATVKLSISIEGLSVTVPSYISFRGANAGIFNLVVSPGLDQAAFELNGLKYTNLDGAQPVTSERILDWLSRQKISTDDATSLGQPWEQAIRVLRDMGHFEDARNLAIVKQDRMRAFGAVSSWARPFHAAYGLLAAYGHRPLRASAIMATIWFVCGVFYTGMANLGVFAPPALSALTKASCDTGTSAAGWYTCSELPPGTPLFQPFVYSLELSLPILDFGQRRTWAPITAPPARRQASTGFLEGVRLDFVDLFDQRLWSKGSMTRIVTWLQLLAGWIGGGIIAAMVGGLAKKRDD